MSIWDRRWSWNKTSCLKCSYCVANSKYKTLLWSKKKWVLKITEIQSKILIKVEEKLPKRKKKWKNSRENCRKSQKIEEKFRKKIWRKFEKMIGNSRHIRLDLKKMSRKWEKIKKGEKLGKKSRKTKKMRRNSEEIRGKSIEKKIRQKNRENSVKMNQINFWKFGGKIGEKKLVIFSM